MCLEKKFKKVRLIIDSNLLLEIAESHVGCCADKAVERKLRFGMLHLVVFVFRQLLERLATGAARVFCNQRQVLLDQVTGMENFLLESRRVIVRVGGSLI